MYINSLNIKNLRCFERTEMQFRNPQNATELRYPNVNLLLGNNGTGKTTILRAISLAILGPILDESGFTARRLIRVTPNTRDIDREATIDASIFFHQHEMLSSKSLEVNSLNRLEIFKILTTYFSYSELEDLMFDMNIDSESIAGDTKDRKSRELIQYFERRGQFPKLITYIQDARPNLVLEGTRNQERSAPKPQMTQCSIENIYGRERIYVPSQRSAEWVNLNDEKSATLFLLGYSATRRAESTVFDPAARAKSRNLRYQKVAGLFEDGLSLVPLGFWLPRLIDKNLQRFQEIKRILDQILPQHCRLTKQKMDDEPAFQYHNTLLPYSALSDGYRAFISWVGDMLYYMTESCPAEVKLTNLTGIVLVDEIDLHLHPSWQLSVIPNLSKALPNLQFIFSTHSPILAGTLQSKNIYLMDTTENGAAMVKQQLTEEVHGKSAEQILLGSYFGLGSTRAPEVERELAELARKAQDGDPDAALEYMRRLA